ncbi:MAG: hypothetical protein GY832_11365 [Chloroflexi bacterium]|nr:hypothetical protein [Chloroflexota bacterium]
MKTLHYEEYDTTAIVTGHLEMGDETVYLEMGGILGHVRAITSAMLMLQYRKKDSGINLDGKNIHLARGGHYRVFTFKAPERKRYGITTKAVILHEQFTSLAKQKGAFHLLLPPDHDISQPPPNFFERLRLAIDVPISSEWTQWLWQKAQDVKYSKHSRLITLRRGDNVIAATVYTDTTKWLDLVRGHLDLTCVVSKTDTGYAGGTWELRKLDRNKWTIFHNGERATVTKEEPNKPSEQVPYVAHNLTSAIKHAQNELGIILILENQQ